jgi:hypothetical protein
MIHTVQLCVHCRRDNAGFWVSHPNDTVIRRPWCLSCSQELDRDRCRVTPFDRWHEPAPRGKELSR